MGSQVVDPDTARSLDAISAGIDCLHAAGVEPFDGRDAIALLTELEVLTRRFDAAKAELFTSIETRQLHRADGHGSAKIMIRHIAGLSPAEAAGRAKAAHMLVDLDAVADTYQVGGIGTDQVRLLGRIHANPRVRDQMPERADAFIEQARALSYRDFELVAREWERLTDEDGTCDTNEANHNNRDAKLIQNTLDLSWLLNGSFGALQGAFMRDTLDHFIDAEYQADWARARAEHGDNACADDLYRSDAQRRADALFKIFQDAAAAPPGSTETKVIHTICWDAETYQAALNAICANVDSETGSTGGVSFDPDRYRCETINGIPLEPFEAATASLNQHLRNAIVSTGGVVEALSRRGRFYTGLARVGVMLQSTTCVWPGCQAPTSSCQADHSSPHRDGGCTDPGNGAPLCGRHNRHKEHGFSTWRDPTGTWHVHRPDRTEIE